ncbi:hypothetical protein [Pontibacter sp. G13]|uniref:hypothetical protein n=1 Tax=Pontibacter sp. G13 TaxID=3074898 RepID=UPI00288B4E13|nr:hypothetical protein [Pontibacter sp. G13]WNJ17584.1 hypothetical protein RJD25_22265 [Pontibacter sp. G13]
MKSFLRFYLLATLVVFLCSCSEKLEFEGDGTLELAFDLNTESAGLNKTQSGNLSFTTGFIRIIEVEFEAEWAGDSSIYVEREQVTTVDFATGAVTPPLNLVVPAGEYEEVSLEVGIFDENDQPAMVFEGSYTKTDGTVVPIVLEVPGGETFEVSGEQVTIASNVAALATLTFDPVSWFNGVRATALDRARVNASGKLLISEYFNEDIFDLVMDGLDRQTEAHFE